jgi:hypothetical protein
MVPGGAWYLSCGGSDAFAFANTSSFRRQALLFGDFDNDGITDVFGVVNGGWYYSKSGTGAWADGLLLKQALPTNFALTLGDFNRDGILDVATYCTTSSITGGSAGWQIWYGGTQSGWSTCNTFGSSFSLVNGPVGHFSGGKGTDILLWNGNGIWSFPGGIGPPQVLSSQDMR